MLRMSGTLYCRSELSSPWGLSIPPIPDCLMLHFVTEGSCWIETSGADGLLARQGDLVLVPHGTGHRLSSDRNVAARNLFDLDREQVSERYEVLRLGEGDPDTQMICGVIHFEHPAGRELIRMLPKAIHVPGAELSGDSEWASSVLRLMAAEAKRLLPGGEAVIIRLADILVIQAIRWWIDNDAGARVGWLGAIRDPQLGRSIRKIHEEPAAAWTLEKLSEEAGMSRSAFAARFTSMVGEPAMQYVARWRMQLAWTSLREEAVTVSQLAFRLGYQSEAAFSRAFKRFMGTPPGSVARDASL